MKRIREILLVSVVLLFSSVFVFGQQQEKRSSSSNVLFILVDDMGWSDASCYGRQVWDTPNIDRLAEQGCRFTSVYAQPLCSPTRSSLLTGKHSTRLGITDWIPGFPNSESSNLKFVEQKKKVDLEEYTLAEAFRDEGYSTGIIGKWHIGNHPSQQGFDTVIQYSATNGCKRFDEDGRFMTDRKGDAAIKFLEDNKNKPFFLYLAFNAVHIPLGASEEKISKHQDAPNPTYAAMIEHVDDNVGRVIAELDKLGLKDNTIVVFYSDNGGVTRCKFEPTIHTLNFPLRGNKGCLYEGGVRVPMIMRYPKLIEKGSVSDVLVGSMDFYPTLLSMCGIEIKNEIDGISFAETFRTNTTVRNQLCWHFPHYSRHVMGFPSGAIRLGEWKLVEWFEDGKLELYNLKEDLGEQNNIADHFPEKTSELKKELDKWRKDTGAKIPERK